jgi:DNA-binding SARP family transcriptional activator/predicted ATPase
MLEVYTLGQIRVHRDNIILTDFISQKTEVLFIYLLMNPRFYERESLASTFWGDTTTEQAMKNLRTALSSLQKQLSDVLLADRQTIGISPEATIWLDVRQFETHLSQFNNPKGAQLSRSAIQQLMQTIDLYGGTFLPGFRSDNAPELDTWVNLERERLLQRAINALGMLIDTLIEWREYQTGITYAYRLLNLDPLSEAGIRRLMRLLAYTGDRNRAIQQYNQFKQSLYEELEVEPEPETLSLFEQVKSGRLRPPVTLPATHNLPHEGGVFIDRPKETALIARQLESREAQVVTLCGVGGAGKTRLALNTAFSRIGEYQHGVYYVPLATVQSADGVAPRILAALPIRQSQGEAASQLIEYLRDKHTLLLLDNFEQVLDAAALVNDIVKAAPNVKILTTSREPLGLRSEYVVRLDGLSLPSIAEDETFSETEAKMSQAVRLFEQVAQRVKPDFSLTSNLNTVVSICHLVDGLPLAIEIAAAHVPVIPLEQIEAHLDSLQNIHRDTPDRHRGIQHLLQDIWTTLDDEERQVLLRVASFPGDFDVAAALHVGATRITVLTRLVNKSLLQQRGERYDLHQIIWRYLMDKRESQGESEHSDAAHTAHYRQWLQTLESRHLRAHEQLNVIGVEYHNLLAALQRTHGEEQLYFAVNLAEYWRQRGFHLQEGVELLRQLTAVPLDDHRSYVRGLLQLGDLLFNLTEYAEASIVLQTCLEAGVSRYPRLHALTLNTLTQICTRTGQIEQAHEYAEQIMSVYESAEGKDHPEIQVTRLLAYTTLGYVNVEIGNNTEARKYLQIAGDIAREMGELRDFASIMNNLGIINLDEDRFDHAYDCYSTALNIAHEIGHKTFIAIFTNNLGAAAASLDRYDEAYMLTLEAADYAQQMNYAALMVYVLNNFVTIHKGMRRAKCAVILQGAEDRLRESLGMPVVMRDRGLHASRMQSLMEQLGQSGFEAAYADGQRLTSAQAVEFAQRCYFEG